VIKFAFGYKLYCVPKQPKGRNLTMTYNNKPNPDDRSDNVEKLQAMITDTIQNMEAAEESLALTDSEEQKQQIRAKNERRRESIDSFRSEIKDEAHNNQG
jgi:small acid-soluble spore protein (thioredoxin-like protein)